MANRDDIRWSKQQFRADIEAVLQGSNLDLDMIVAVACQETGEIWSVLRKTSLSRTDITALCVGDTIDFKGPGKGRQAFPRSKGALLAEPNGQAMFDIARKALVDMATYIPSYRSAAANPDKFCHGFGIFQRDLQFFKEDPAYFLNKSYENFDHTLAHCLAELREKIKKLKFDKKAKLSDADFASVAIAYNTGGFNPAKGLKQGFFDGDKFYGERIFDLVTLSRTVDVAPATAERSGRFVVMARDGLKLRKGPGTDFDAVKTLPAGTELTVVGFDGTDRVWARVDLEDDGLLDGHVFAAFLAPAGDGSHHAEDVPEPDAGA